MATYGTLLSEVQTLTNTEGQTDVAEVAKLGLRRTLIYIAQKVDVPELRTSATYTWQDGDESISITGAGGFNASDFATPIRLYSEGIPYDFRDWFEWLDLQSIPIGERETILRAPTVDERPLRCWTINPDNEVLLSPVDTDDEITLYYFKEPAAYDTNGTPELNARFHHILVDGAVLFVKEFLREPEAIINPTELFSKLGDSISELDIHQRSLRRRVPIKLSQRYRPY